MSEYGRPGTLTALSLSVEEVVEKDLPTDPYQHILWGIEV
jgi:hypothetical protein